MIEAPRSVAEQLRAYNAGDLAAFAACYSPEVVLEDAQKGPFVRGLEELRARYGALFREHPENRARVLNRSVVLPWVFEEEEVARDALASDGTRTPTTFRILVIYRIAGDLIDRAVFFR